MRAPSAGGKGHINITHQGIGNWEAQCRVLEGKVANLEEENRNWENSYLKELAHATKLERQYDELVAHFKKMTSQCDECACQSFLQGWLAFQCRHGSPTPLVEYVDGLKGKPTKPPFLEGWEAAKQAEEQVAKQVAKQVAEETEGSKADYREDTLLAVSPPPTPAPNSSPSPSPPVSPSVAPITTKTKTFVVTSIEGNGPVEATSPEKVEARKGKSKKPSGNEKKKEAPNSLGEYLLKALQSKSAERTAVVILQGLQPGTNELTKKDLQGLLNTSTLQGLAKWVEKLLELGANPTQYGRVDVNMDALDVNPNAVHTMASRAKQDLLQHIIIRRRRQYNNIKELFDNWENDNKDQPGAHRTQVCRENTNSPYQRNKQRT
jgi:hypothetical protein